MSYSGENKLFGFRDGVCEALTPAAVTTKEAAELGRILAGHFDRFAAGCCGFAHLPILYALCSGISECGRDVSLSENTDLPSFRFGFPLFSAQCGVFISGPGLRLCFYDRNGFPLSSGKLAAIMNSAPAPVAERSGRISSFTSFRDIYLGNIADISGNDRTLIPAGVSCGNRAVRSLWLEFFTGEDDELVFQISDDGQKVNAYTRELGFISADKLTLAYCRMLADEGVTVWLPEEFHFAADALGDVRRFAEPGDIPESAEVRFLKDPLYMCTRLAGDKMRLISLLRRIPKLASARRELVLSSAAMIGREMIPQGDSRIIMTRSGRDRITLLAQALSAETASELCAEWADKLRRADRPREL